MSTYITTSPSEAVGFNGYGHASAWEVMGFKACDLQGRISCESVGLRNACGDYIKSITEWIKHDPRVIKEHRKLISAFSNKLNTFPDLLKTN